MGKKKGKVSLKTLHCKGKRSPRANNNKNNKSSTSISNNNSRRYDNKKLVKESQRDIEAIDGLDSGVSKDKNGADHSAPLIEMMEDGKLLVMKICAKEIL